MNTRRNVLKCIAGSIALCTGASAIATTTGAKAEITVYLSPD